jgi:hypothetical protein
MTRGRIADPEVDLLTFHIPVECAPRGKAFELLPTD